MSIASNLAGAAVTIGGTAALICAGRGQREDILIQNLHATQDLYVGPSGVTTSSGVKVPAGDAISLSGYSGPVYGIASGAGTDVRYLEAY